LFIFIKTRNTETNSWRRKNVGKERFKITLSFIGTSKLTAICGVKKANCHLLCKES